jgi:hypothetical protein
MKSDVNKLARFACLQNAMSRSHCLRFDHRRFFFLHCYFLTFTIPYGRRKTGQFSCGTQKGDEVAERFASVRKETGRDRGLQKLVPTPVHFEM